MKNISKIVLGTMIIGLKNYDKSKELLDCALSLGINSLDLALVYGGGDSERAVGRWMEERNNREDIFILTKGAHPNADRERVTPYDITADIMDSLARLKTFYIDAYLLHRDDPTKPVGPIIDVLNEHYKAGRIRAFGGSNWTHARIAEANEYAKANGLQPMTVSSPNFGLCEQVDDPWGPGCVTISGKENAAARDFYKTTGIPVFAYSSLGRGLLSGRVTRENYNDLLDGAAKTAYAYDVNFKKLDAARELAKQKNVSVPQIALAYLLAQPFLVYPIVGAASITELNELAAVPDIILTPEECDYLENAG